MTGVTTVCCVCEFAPTVEQVITKPGLLAGGETLGVPANLPSLFGVKQSERGLWLGWKYVHTGGVHEISVFPEHTTDDDKT